MQRPRADIEKDGARIDILMLEVLLDLRDLLVKQAKKKKGANKNGKQT